MNRPNPFAVAIVSGVLGALGCLGVLQIQEKPTDRVQECVYAVVRDFPTYTGTTPLGNVEKPCKGLSAAQKKQAGKQLSDFIDKSLATLNG